MLDYKLIEALALVVLEGGFEKAAVRLHISQSAVSQRIKLLEEQAGQVLLARSTPPAPTPAGRQMIKHYQQVRRLEEDLLRDGTPTGDKSYTTLSIGINDDSLATWFLEAVFEFLQQERVLLDLRSDDQEQTHQLLKNGEVIGCISAKEQPMQGCRLDYLGCMQYRLLAHPRFARQWFPRGLDATQASLAPLVVYNRKDELHLKFFRNAFGAMPASLTVHYLPSSDRFLDFIAEGLACGMLPDQQSTALLNSGALIDLLPGCFIAVKLHWHRWNLNSPLLERFSRHLVRAADQRLRTRPSGLHRPNKD